MPWLQEIRRIFESVYGPASDLKIVITDNAGREVSVAVPKEEAPRGSEIELAILRAASQLTAPVSSKQLARLAGYKYNSYYLEAVTRLVRSGQLRRTADGVA